MANNTDWLNISQMTGGTGETALSLTALTNSSLEPKTATITARNTQYNVSDTTTVTIQGFQPTLTLSRSTLRFDSTGGTATFTVYSNTAWAINFPALVHSYSTSAGTGDTEVTVVLAQNLDEVGKVDTGTVQDIFGVNQLYLTIVQESFITELTVTPDDDIVFANTGSSTSITIDTNTDWEIDYPAWITPSVVSGTSGTTTVVLTAPANGPEDRSNEITIYAGSKSVTINAFQPFYIPPYITVTPSSWEFRYIEDGRTFTVDSYPEWTAEIVSSGEIVWTSDAYMEAVFDIPSAMTMPLWVGNNGSTTGVYLGPIIHYGSSVTFPSSGTYVIRYEMLDDGTTPVLQGNQYLKELYLTDGVGAIQSSAFTGCTALTSVTIGSGLTRVGAAAFSGCSSLNNITIAAQTAPYVGDNTFYGVATGGTLHYPAGSDYSSWLSIKPNYLGYAFWNNLSPTMYYVFTVTYDVTSTGATKILAQNGGGALNYPLSVNFVRDEQGNITPLEKGQTTFRFNTTGKHRLDLSTVSSTGLVDFSGVTAATDIQVNNVGNGRLSLCGSTFTGLTLYKNLSVYRGRFNRLKKLVITGSTSSWPGYYVTTYIETVEVFGNITSIPTDAFNLGYALKNVTLSDKITSLGRDAFYKCTSLQSIVIPSGVTSIGQHCFAKCTSLQSITANPLVAPSLDYASLSLESGLSGVLYYPAGSDYSTWLSRLGSNWTGVEI